MQPNMYAIFLKLDLIFDHVQNLLTVVCIGYIDVNFYFQVTEELGSDELIRRLKSLAHTFQVLQQAEDESTYVDYTPLALHLADDFFLNHASRDVQLLVRY